MGQSGSNFGEEMKVGDLIRHKDDRLDQFYVVIDDYGFTSMSRKIKHVKSGWVHFLSSTEQWVVVASNESR